MFQKNKLCYMAILFIFILLAACKSADEVNTTEKGEEQTEEHSNVENEREAVEINIEEPETSVAREDQGDFDINWEITVEELEDKYIIHGESNLLPETRVRIYLKSPDYTIVGYYKNLTVEEDGTFSGELNHLQKYDTEINLGFDVRPQMQQEEILNHYGERFEHATGPFVAVRDSDGDEVEYYVTTTLTHYPKKGEYTELVSEVPEWDFPSDQGDLEVRIEIDEIEKDESRFYITGKTNLLDGSVLAVDVNLPEYIYSFGYNAHKYVNPDGSFSISVKYPQDKDEDKMDLVFKFTPSQYGQSDYIQNHYGPKGENLQGDIAEEQSGGMKNIELRVNVQ
ncbi:hypothetical protein [Alkalihalobacterium bogoriense]|uniref:hypothetical protein n=1 Tax=Alkalihalobacterium bogoriense TaxID=246272 RepID=UPI00047E2193|nr:hypothetical protein [Alkalihalobacterium bogoriense]